MTQTKRTTKFPIEEIYTEADRSGSHDGRYTFYAPMSWAGDITLDKAVAVRRAKVVPPAMIIPFGIRFNIPYKDTDNSTKYCPWDYTVSLIIEETTTLYDIMSHIGNNLTDSTTPKIKLEPPESEHSWNADIIPVYNYDFDTHRFTLEFSTSTDRTGVDNSEKIGTPEFRLFVGAYEDTYGVIAPGDDAYATNENIHINPNSRINKLHQLFNQTSSSDALYSSINGVLTLENVWDRQALEIHASFSNSKNRFIALNGDFYQSRNMIFNARNGFNAFDVWFSTDGTHRLILRDDIHFIFQLTFINHVEISIAKDY